MKKGCLVPLLLLLASSVFEAGTSLGLEVSYLPGVLENQTASQGGVDYIIDYSFSSFAVRGFADFTYVVLSAGYRSAVSDLKAEGSGGFTGTATDTFSMSQVEIRLLGKYPIRAGSLVFAPMAGAEYTICLAGKDAGTAFDSTLKKEYNDLSLLGGLGMEFTVSPNMYIRPSLMLGYSLTSKRNSDYYAGFSYVSSSGFEWEIAVAIGYLLEPESGRR